VSAAAEVAALLGPRARTDVALGPLTTYRVGGSAAVAVEVADPDDLAELARAVHATGVPTLVVGKGSNLLVADSGFDGLAVLLGAGFAEISLTATLVRAGAAVSLRCWPAAPRPRGSPGSSGRWGCRDRSAERCA
jgi:UDP-N-acetylmuramate dehydrogenase